MEFRTKLFGFLSFLSVLMIIVGFGLGAISANEMAGGELSRGRGLSSLMSVAVISTICLTALPYICVCTPLAVIFGLLAWRNNAGLVRERMHQEQIEAIIASSTKQQ